MSKRDERFDFWMETHFISSFAVSADRTPPPPSMSQIILLKWGRELGASLQTFQVFYPFFIFFIRFSEIGLWNTTGQVRKIYHFSFFPWLRQLNQFIYFTKVKGQMLNCNATHQILRVFHLQRIKFNLLGFKNFFSVNIFCIVLCVWVKDFNFLMSAFVWQENILFLRRLLSSWMQMFSRANIATTSLTFPQVPKTKKKGRKYCK